MTRRIRAVALAAALALLPFVAPEFCEAQDPEAETAFRVEEAELDLGSIVAGTTVTATFVFINDGPDDVHIIRAKPS